MPKRKRCGCSYNEKSKKHGGKDVKVRKLIRMRPFRESRIAGEKKVDTLSTIEKKKKRKCPSFFNMGCCNTRSSRAKPAYRSVKLYTAYLGEVPVDVYDFADGSVALQTYIEGLPGRGDLLVKCLDVQTYKIYPEEYDYDADQLAGLEPSHVEIEECKRNHEVISKLEGIQKIRKLTYTEKKVLHRAYVYNNAVDIHFNTCQYVDFLHKKLSLNNIIDSSYLLSMHNVPLLDNAFFTGKYMVYGNGNSYFYPLGTSDIGGHELGHGIVQTLSGLEYRGHAGALNEHFADVFGVCFEFFLYKKFNTVLGDEKGDLKNSSDWTIGEDSGKLVSHLRDMKDPTSADQPQPKYYKGEHWEDPNSEEDHGGVHTNSGVGNHCFYLLSQSIGKQKALQIFYKCLCRLGPTSSYMEFRDILKKITNHDDNLSLMCVGALDKCGLTSKAESDWL